MKKHYPWLWFDADGTLFDFARAEAQALPNTFAAVGLPYEPAYMQTYQRINHALWAQVERGEMTQSTLQARRFELLLEELNLSTPASQFGATFVEQLGLGAQLLDGAHEILNTLHKTSRIAIVTNGLTKVQTARLANSTIHQFVSALIISEEIGAAKPQADFFRIASARTAGPPKEHVLMVGDMLHTDIRGGADYGLDTCWFNPKSAERPDDLPITYEIKHLVDLLEILE